MSMPPPAVCDRARQTKDARFDGLFFTGVRSTRIYCRPVCPAPTPKPQNIQYFPSAAAAAGAGYRPCLRCRPELSPDIAPRDQTVRRALGLIAQGWLEEGSIESLASHLAVSSRHLRRLFIDKTGATALQVHQAQRLAVAKQLLSDTALPVTQVALASGFASVRRFNDAFRARCGMSPSAVRRRPATLDEDDIALRLAYRPPFDFDATLDVLRTQSLPGIERVRAGAYERIVSVAHAAAWIQVTASTDKPELKLRAVGVRSQDIPLLVRRVRRMFDLDADLNAAHEVMRQDVALSASIADRPGLRIPGAWDGFELSVACLLRPSAASDKADAIAHRLIDRYGARVEGAPPGLDRRFPDADLLAVADLEATIGATAASARAVRGLALAVRDRRVHFGPGQVPEELIERFMACTGAGVECAHEVACRALGDPDAWPVGSTAVEHRWVSATSGAAAWRPWRSYAALHLGLLPGRSGAGAASTARVPSLAEAA
jgi:AraC family transcriptional regulator, regulatory protein of adaptative response / DNA-3-methyladenine glycosylase II